MKADVQMVGSHARNWFFPYGMRQDDEGNWTFFNRAYKTIGFRTEDWVDDAAYPVSFSVSKRSINALLRRDAEQQSDDVIFFYNDGTNPSRNKANMKRYLKILEYLIIMPAD